MKASRLISKGERKSFISWLEEIEVNYIKKHSEILNYLWIKATLTHKLILLLYFK